MRLLKHKEISIKVIINITECLKNTDRFKRRFLHEVINSLTEVVSLVIKASEVENTKDIVKILNLFQLASAGLLIAKELSIIKPSFYENNERLLYTGRLDLRAMLKNNPEIKRF